MLLLRGEKNVNKCKKVSGRIRVRYLIANMKYFFMVDWLSSFNSVLEILGLRCSCERILRGRLKILLNINVLKRIGSG